MFQKKSTPAYVLPNKNTRAKTKESPYQMKNISSLHQPGDQSSDYIDGERDYPLSGMLKKNNQRAAISQHNQSFDSKSAIQDRSLSVG